MAEVRAQLKVVRFFGKGDTLPTFKDGNQLVSAPKSVQQQQTVVPEFVPQFAPPTQQSQPQFVSPPVQQQPTATTSADEDLSLLLSE